MISGARRDVDDICALLGCYAAYSGNFLPTFRDGTDRFNRNVGKKNYHYVPRNNSEERSSLILPLPFIKMTSQFFSELRAN